MLSTPLIYSIPIERYSEILNDIVNIGSYVVNLRDELFVLASRLNVLVRGTPINKFEVHVHVPKGSLT